MLMQKVRKGTAKFLYRLTMVRSRNLIQDKYGKDFRNKFKDLSDRRFKELMAEFQDIGDSMFAFNYCYAPGYVAWYTSMEKLGLDLHERDVLMLEMNERMLCTVPKPLLHAVGKAYYRNMSKGAKRRMEKKPKSIHPFDWEMEYTEDDKDNFRIDIKTCGFIAYTKKYGGEGMLPGICQVDYMISHYMNVGFERTQTLGAGGRCCDGCYHIKGKCDFDIEQRLAERR